MEGRLKYYVLVLSFLAVLALISCGGAPTSQPSPNPGPPLPCTVFPVWVMPTTVAIAQESSEAVAVGLNGYVTVPGAQCIAFFTTPASVQVSGLPAGVTVSPASLVLTPQGAPQPLTFSVSASAAPGNMTLTLTGTSSTMTASTSFPFYIMPANPLTPTPKCLSSTPPPASSPSPAPNEWTWESGSNALNQPGVYGTEGVPSVTNVPGARAKPSSWTDSSSLSSASADG